MRNRSLGFLALLFLSGLLSVSPGRGADEARGPLPRVAQHSLIAALSRAQAVRIQEDKVLEGRWSFSRFRFMGLPPVADIFVSETVLVEGKAHSAIWFQPWEDFDSSLIFPPVPPGKRLVLAFALGDSDFAGGKPNLIHFEVWIGKKKLFDTRVSTKGWKEKTLDLTLPFLLQRNFRLSFKVEGSDRQPSNFVFYGHIE